MGSLSSKQAPLVLNVPEEYVSRRPLWNSLFAIAEITSILDVKNKLLSISEEKFEYLFERAQLDLVAKKIYEFIQFILILKSSAGPIEIDYPINIYRRKSYIRYLRLYRGELQIMLW